MHSPLQFLPMSECDIAIIGGGAAGYFAAIAAAEANPALRVMILERNRNPLSKVRISGGGRCNVTNACFDPAELVKNYPRGAQALRGPFTRFAPQDTMAWFERRGVTLKTERDGRVFPITDDSATIVNCLMDAAARAGVSLRTGANVGGVQRVAGGYAITLLPPRADDNAQEILCAKLLLASGSSAKGWAMAHALGHTIIAPAPSLFSFVISAPALQDLAGVAVKEARLRLDGTRHEQTGPVLITHQGLSGPAALKLSAWAARELHERQYAAGLEVSWLPHLHDDALRQTLAEYKQSRGPQLVAAHSPFGVLPHRLWQKLAHAAEIHEDQRWAKLPRANMEKLIRELLHGRYAICGKGEFKEEFVTCGGVALDEVNFKTMESKLLPGLFFAGEVLDIDALTGGFNLQNAWTTGWIAGNAMA